MEGVCSREPGRTLRSLNAYEHLKRFFRLCVTHFKRNIKALETHISDDVYAAMLSLSSSRPHPDLEGAFKKIDNGGRKAKGMARKIKLDITTSYRRLL